MKVNVDERMRPVVVARSDIRHRSSDRHVPNHGFFNARNASLPEVPLRNWGRINVPPREMPTVHPEQKR